MKTAAYDTPEGVQRRPNTGDAMLRITFRCGEVREYVARQLRWGSTDHAFDVVAYERVQAKTTQLGAWSPVSGGY